MKKVFLMLVFACFASARMSAQFYSQGDISLSFVPMVNHDSTICSTQGQLFYQITVQNSFIGDTVKVKDMSGYLVYQDVNTTGMNPWNVFAPVMIAGGVIADNNISGGMANFGGPSTKVICGPDTIYNINNYYSGPVTNPCHYGNVSGMVYVDQNGDCIFNGSDAPLNAVLVGSNVALSSPSMSSTWGLAGTDMSGNYNMQLQESWMTSYSVAIPSQYQFIFPLASCTPVSYTYTTLPQANVDFALQCTSNMDVQCAAYSSGAVRPLLPFTLSPYVSNTGCSMASGVIKLLLDPDVVYNASLSSNPATSVVGDTLMWNYSNLTNLSAGMYWNSFFAGVHLTPTAAVNIGDVLCFEVLADAPAGDVDPVNNSYSFCLSVVNSYDPNMKEVSPKGVGTAGNILPSTPDLTYTIHFQNTGNAAAINVSVIDTLDANVDAGSLEILGATHAMSPLWLAPNVVKFTFYSIMLPDSTTNEPLSHGAVSFKVNLNPALPLGTEIKNTGYIYFDSNPAIVTNTTLNTIAVTTGISEQTQSASVTVYPNPFTDNTTFVISDDLQNGTYTFEITDVLGKKVNEIKNISDKQFSISRNDLQNGIYFYKIYSTEKIIGAGKLIIK